MVAQAPTGTVTFLFTDIEGSTGLWEQHPDDMARALARHDEIVRGAVEHHGGHVFATGGDGFAVAFARAADALDAAKASQHALAEEPWGVAVIKVRMGLHIGDAEERDGDYFGPTLNRAARIMSAGHGGQILTSQAFGEISASDELLDLGEHRLRDLSGPQRVYQVGSGVFPDLRSIDAFPSNLPRTLSTFVGRESQIEQVVDDLRINDLVTLTGTGGVGKTRLAVQASAEALPHLAGGAWFVDLATIRDPAQLTSHLAMVLGVKERSGEPLTVTLRDVLEDLAAVIVLDNGEHVVDALAELITDLTSRKLAAKFLITSREPLGLDGEQVRRVPSLSSEEATDLFVQRATNVRDDVDFGSYHPQITEICDRLDGIPLAIELAAARSRSMLPGDILSRLDERFRLLSGGRRTARERHQTLLATVEWSYDLLDDDERVLFDRLAVFRGGFDLEAVEAVCSGGGIDELDVVDLLDRLVDKSMVAAYQSIDRSRFRMLETLRQFGESRLVVGGTADEYRERHLDHFRNLARRLAPSIRSTEQQQVLREFERETSNLNTAMERLADTARWEEFRRLCHIVLPFWSSVGSPDGVRWYLTLVDNIDNLDPRTRTRALAGASYIVFNAGLFAAGFELAERAMEAAEDPTHPDTCYAYFALANWCAANWDPSAAVEYAETGAELARQQDMSFLELAYASVALFPRIYLRDPAAGSHLADFVVRAEQFGMPTMIAAARSAQGIHLSLDGEYEAAERYLGEAIETARGVVPHVLVQACTARAQIRNRVGTGDVIDAVREALDVFADTPVQPEQVADIWVLIATVWLGEERVEDAAILACAAGALLTSLGIRGRAENADLRQKLGDDLASVLSPAELDACIESTGEMTAAEVRRFILERI